MAIYKNSIRIIRVKLLIKKILKIILPEKIKHFLEKCIRFYKFKFSAHTKKEQSKLPKTELMIFKLLCDEFQTVFDVGAREYLDYYFIKPDCAYHLFEPNTKFTES